MVWETLIDVERVAPCLPGAEISGSTDDVYEGAFTVKLGPTAAAYAGKLEMEEVDEAAHRVTMKASGRDKRGQGSANATIESSIRGGRRGDHGRGRHRLHAHRPLARFGRGGMIEDVSNRLLRDFATCLQSSIAGPTAECEEVIAPPPAQPIRGVRLFLSVLWERIKRFFRRLFGR